MLSTVAVVFAAVFLAELPDKTMFATLLLSTRYRSRSAVWAGVSVAYVGHVVVASALGGFLSRLPREPVQMTIGGLFLVAGLWVLWSSRGTEREESDAGTASDGVTWRRTFTIAVSTVGVAEFADITQLATAGFAASTGRPLAVGVGAAAALVSVSGLAVLVGRWLVSRVPLRFVQRAAGVLFIALGIIAFF